MTGEEEFAHGTVVEAIESGFTRSVSFRFPFLARGRILSFSF